MSKPEVLLSGLGIPESPRWHQGRLWFANWIERQVVALGLDGRAEVMPVRADRAMGYSIDWLPDGRLLLTGDQVRCQEPDGSVRTLADQAANEMGAATSTSTARTSTSPPASRPDPATSS